MRSEMRAPRAVRVGVQKGQHPLFLVVLHELPENPGAGHGRHAKQHHHPDRQAGQDDDEDAGHRDQERGAEVRLPCDQHRRHDDQNADHHQVHEFRRQLPVVQVPGRHHRYREFHDLGRLEANPDIEPALRALANFAA